MEHPIGRVEERVEATATDGISHPYLSFFTPCGILGILCIGGADSGGGDYGGGVVVGPLGSFLFTGSLDA